MQAIPFRLFLPVIFVPLVAESFSPFRAFAPPSEMPLKRILPQGAQETQK